MRAAKGAREIGTRCDLMERILAGEDGLGTQKLSQDATDRPHVYLGVVLPILHQQLWSAVPSRHDVLGELGSSPPALIANHPSEVGFRVRMHAHAPFGDPPRGLGHAACEAEVCERELAISVEQQVRRLHVPVNDAGGVQVAQCTEHLPAQARVNRLTQSRGRANSAARQARQAWVRATEASDQGRSGSSARLGSARLGSARLGSARAWLGSARAWLGSAS